MFFEVLLFLHILYSEQLWKADRNVDADALQVYNSHSSNQQAKEDDYISVFNKNFANKEIKINSSQIDFKISDTISNLNAFSRFLNIEYDQFPNTFEELDSLCKKQNNISGTRIGKRNKTYYFIENNNIVGALMCPKKVRSRRILKSVFKILLNCRSQVIYTNIHDDWINSVLFLAGFILANKSNQQDSLLWKWERLEETKR